MPKEMPKEMNEQHNISPTFIPLHECYQTSPSSLWTTLQNLYELATWWEIGDSQDKLKNLVKSSKLFYLLLVDNQIIGMGRAIGDHGSDIYIQDIFIHPDFQGKGFGKVLVEKIVKELKLRGYTFIALISNPGKSSFYEKLGFSIMKDFVPMRLMYE